MKMTKLKVFLISLVGAGLCLLVSGTKMLIFWCGIGNHLCRSRIDYFGDYIVLFLPILLFSVITYFVKEEVFRAWLKFTYWYFLIYILIIFFLSDSRPGGLGLMLDSEFFAVSLSGLYVITSFLMVILLFPLKASKK